MAGQNFYSQAKFKRQNREKILKFILLNGVKITKHKVRKPG